MSGIQALRERLGSLNQQANKLLADNGDRTWSKEDQAKYDSLMDEADRLSGQIKAMKRQMDDEAENQVDQATKDALRNSKGKTDLVQGVQALDLYLRLGNNLTPEQAATVRNAMSTGTGAEGGFTVPTEVAKMVIDAIKAYGGMTEVADVITTDSGNAWNYPASDGTAEEGEIVGENAAASTGEITFSQVPMVTYRYSSKKLALPVELIQDSGIDIVSFVVNRLSTRLARIQNKHQTIGTGSGQPSGIVTRSTAGRVGATGSATSVTYDDLVQLVHSVNRGYRRRAKFMMADASVSVLRRLKDGNGRPIFTPGYEAGITQDAPDRLLGYAIAVNDDMPVMAANAKSILFGDLKQYQIRNVRGDVSIRRFDDSAFALNGQVGFCGWQRSGGNLLDTAAVKHFQNSAT